MPALTTIQLRRGTTSEWSSSISPLTQGEMGFDTVIKKMKIGDGSTLWSGLPWANITGADFVGVSGISISYSSPSGTITVAVTGLNSNYISDFTSAVSGLLPVKNIVGGTNISVTSSNGVYTVSTDGLDSNAVKDVVGSTIVGVSGIRASYNSITKVETISVTGLTSSYIGDFNSSVSGLVNGIYAPLTSPALSGIPTVPTAAADTNTTQIANTAFVLGQAASSSPLMDGSVSVGTSYNYARADHVHPTDTSRAALSGATFTGNVNIPSGSGNFTQLNVNSVPVSVSGHTHTASNITDFNSSVSGLLGVKSLASGSGIGIVNVGGNQTISVTGIPSSLITDLGNIATTQVIGRTGVALTYDAVTDTMYIDTTGVSLVGHNHTWSNITDASTKATLAELAYLSGVVAGTASASRALVVDSSKNLTGINTLTTVSDVTVGGNLTVQGTTTTVNSTTVNIGDNIIRVNTSGLSTGGLEVYNGSTTYSVLWNNTTSRWEFTGGNVYTSGNFVGNLTGNASTVTNGVYTTDTGTVTSTMIANDTIVNADINSSAAIAYSKLNLSSSIVNADISASAAIVDTKLATISTAGKVSNSATTATSSNTGSAIVARDSSGNFSAGTITANLAGNATTVTNGIYTTDTGTVTSTMIANDTIVNADINSSAAIAYSKLNLSSSITNSDINNSAAIAYTKLNLASGIVNNDISSSAAIAYSKLNLSASITNSDISNSAAISDSKLNTISTAGKVANSATTATNLNTALAIVSRDASGNFSAGTITANLSGNATTVTNGVYTTDTGTVTSAMIADNTIVNADISSSAAIVDTKLATISTSGKVSNSATTATNLNTASAIVARDSSGNFIAGTITATLNGNASTVTNGVYTTDTGTVTNAMLAGSIAYSKLNLSGSITNSDIATGAAIAVTKLASSGVTLGTTLVNLGQTVTTLAGLTSISGVSAASPTTLYYCVIDGGTP